MALTRKEPQLKKESGVYRDNTGATTIVIVCVMAVIMALSLGLFLSASVLVKTSGRTLATEQSRILAVSFSEQVDQMLTGEGNAYESRADEEAGKAEKLSGISIWHYVKQNICDGSWVYYAEGEDSLHSAENSVRTFQMTQSGVVGEIADIVLSMYWTKAEEGNRPGKLFVETTVTIKDQTCTITDVYELGIYPVGDYEKWIWKHIEKK